MPITLSPAYIKKLLKQSPGTVVREANLYLEVGTGKKKVVHARFYYKNPGRKYRKLGTLDADCTAQHCKTIHADYIEMYTNWNRGISPDLVDKQTAIEHQRKEDELTRIDALKTVDQIWVDYFERRLEGKASADTRRYSYEKHIQKQIGDRPADYVDHQTLINLIRDASTNGDSAGNTTCQILGVIGHYGFENGFLSDDKNWRKLPKNPSPQRTRVATEKELAWLLNKGSVLIKPSICLGQRAWQHLKIEWEEIDGDWLNIPASKMKMDRAHRVFITTTVHDLFQESRERFSKDHPNYDSHWIFAGKKTGDPVRVETGSKQFHLTNVQSVQRKSEKVTLRMQDLRRTCYTFIEQKFSPVISGAVAGHTKDAMGRVYGQYDYEKEKKEAMLEWEKHLLNLMN